MIYKLWYLSQMKLFDNVPPEDMEEINKWAHHAKIRKHTIIQTPEMVRDGLYFIKEGALRLYTVNKDRSRDQKSHGFKLTLNIQLK